MVDANPPCWLLSRRSPSSAADGGGVIALPHRHPLHDAHTPRERRVHPVLHDRDARPYDQGPRSFQCSRRGDALKLCEKFGVPNETVEITPMADAYFNRDTEMNSTRKGNVMARLRMIVLYDLSARDAALVIGTSNKTEIMLGYSTLWGDMASAVNPLGDLYKYQVFALSRHMGVIDEILNKAPSADLWSGQTDEGEMGFSYAMADLILYYWLERRYTVDSLKSLVRSKGADEAVVDMVLRRVQRNAYKRVMPVIAKLSPVTIGREFRTPRDWGM